MTDKVTTDDSSIDSAASALSAGLGVQFAVPTAEGVKDALEAVQAACKARKWTLIAPDGRVWQNENPMLISAALLAELGGYMKPLGGDFARILDENRWALYGDTEATPNKSLCRT